MKPHELITPWKGDKRYTEIARRAAALKKAGANAAATACSANDATATRPDAACSDTRHDTKPQPPARNADYTTDENEGSQEDEATMYLPKRSDKATAQRRSQANDTRPTAARPEAAAHAPLNVNHSGAGVRGTGARG